MALSNSSLYFQLCSCLPPSLELFPYWGERADLPHLPLPLGSSSVFMHKRALGHRLLNWVKDYSPREQGVRDQGEGSAVAWNCVPLSVVLGANSCFQGNRISREGWGWVGPMMSTVSSALLWLGLLLKYDRAVTYQIQVPVWGLLTLGCRTGWHLFPGPAHLQRQAARWGAVHRARVLKHAAGLCGPGYSIPQLYQFVRHLFSYSRVSWDHIPKTSLREHLIPVPRHFPSKETEVTEG